MCAGMVLGLGLAVGAQAEMTYEQKVAELKKSVDLTFSAGLPFVKRAEGVNHLYQLVMESDAGVVFGAERAIREVQIREAYTPAKDSKDYPTVMAQRSLPREHLILYAYDGQDDENILKEYETFQVELDEIARLEKQVKENVAIAEFRRKQTISGGYTAVNRAYLANLRLIDDLSGSAAFRQKVQTFGKIWFDDTSPDDRESTIRRAQYMGFEDGKTVVRTGLWIQMGRKGYFDESSALNSTVLQQMLDVVFVHGFDGFNYYDLDKVQIDALMTDFAKFLTAERVEKLQARKIKRFVFSSMYHWEKDIINGDVLTLGTTYDDMVKVYTLIFGN